MDIWIYNNITRFLWRSNASSVVADFSENLILIIIIFSKAFDTVSHDITLKKLDNMGIIGEGNTFFILT